MSFDVRILLALGLALLAISMGVAIRVGWWRAFERIYRDEQLPAAYRNSPFALIPGGLAFASGGLVGVFSELRGWRTVGLVLAVLTVAMFLIAFVVAHRPPRLLKPKWLRDEESLSGPADIAWDGFDVLIFLATVGAAVLTLLAMLFLIVRQA